VVLPALVREAFPHAIMLSENPKERTGSAGSCGWFGGERSYLSGDRSAVWGERRQRGEGSQRWRTSGSAAAKRMGGWRPLQLKRERLLARIAEKPELTLRAVVAELAERGTSAESTFEVGRRFRCTMRVDCGQLDPGSVIRRIHPICSAHLMQPGSEPEGSIMDRRGVLKSVMSTVGGAGLIAASGGAVVAEEQTSRVSPTKAARLDSSSHAMALGCSTETGGRAAPWSFSHPRAWTPIGGSTKLPIWSVKACAVPPLTGVGTVVRSSPAVATSSIRSPTISAK
jgi:hypothetical protein